MSNISRRRLLAALAACPVCAFAADTEWNYRDRGPEKWAALDPAFGLCGTGTNQSPLDLRDGAKASFPALHIDWKPEKFTILNNGHTIQANAPDGSFIEVGAARSRLIQFHFHSPSEHAMDGRRTGMEAHFVHRNGGGKLTVVAVLLTPGGQNAAFSAVMSTAPLKSGGQGSTTMPIDPAEFLPASRETWRYEGSLTTPPCSEGVDWIIFRQTKAVAAADIDKFRGIFHDNARPLRPIGRREILHD